jgi:hypothetical protein
MVWPSSIRAVAGWALATAALALGVYVLFDFWQGFNEFAINRGLGYPSGWHFEIMFWYALPGFQAGVLVGMLPFGISRGLLGLLLVLNLVVWIENVINFGIIFYLVSHGVLF